MPLIFAQRSFTQELPCVLPVHQCPCRTLSCPGAAVPSPCTPLAVTLSHTIESFLPQAVPQPLAVLVTTRDDVPKPSPAVSGTQRWQGHLGPQTPPHSRVWWLQEAELGLLWHSKPGCREITVLRVLGFVLLLFLKPSFPFQLHLPAPILQRVVALEIFSLK